MTTQANPSALLARTPTPITFPHRDHLDEGHSNCVYAIALTPSYLITGSRDHSVRIWSLQTQRLLHPPMQAHTAAVLCIQASEDSDMVFSGSVDATVCMWRLSTGELIKRWKAHGESVLSLSFNDRYLVTGSKERSVKIWDRGAQALSTLYTSSGRGPSAMDEAEEMEADVVVREGIRAAVNRVYLTTAHLIAASGDRTVKLYHVGTWECIRSVELHARGIATIAVSPDEKTLLTGSSDNSIKLTDIETGAEVAHLKEHENLIRSLAVPPQEGFSVFASGSYDGSVLIWKKSSRDGEWGPRRVMRVTDVVEGLVGDGVVSMEDVRGDLSYGDEEFLLRVFGMGWDGRRVVCGNQTKVVVGWDFGE